MEGFREFIKDAIPFTEEELLALKNFYLRYEKELKKLGKEITHYIFYSPLAQKIFRKYKRPFSEIEAAFHYAVKAFFTQEEEFFWKYGIAHYEVAASSEGFSAVLDALLYLFSKLNSFIEKKIKEGEVDEAFIPVKNKALINYVSKCGKAYIPLWLKEHEKLLFISNYLYNFLSAVIKDLNEALIFQRRFLANISHEIRTPLNSILGYLRLLEREEGLPAEAKSFVKRALESTDVLLRLINDILDASKLQAGEMEILSQPLNILRTISEVIQLFKQPRKNVVFKWSVDYYPYYLLGDKERIKQTVTNLLSNAFKFTKKGKVELILRVIDKEDKAEVIIIVVDTGLGISPERNKHLFQPFKQIEVSSSGTGLGLYISREIARRMGGDIRCESEPGKGTIFYVRLLLPKGEKIKAPSGIKGKHFLIFAPKCPCSKIDTIYYSACKQSKLRVLEKFLDENQAKYTVCHKFSKFKQLYEEKKPDYILVFYSAIKQAMEEEGKEGVLETFKAIKEPKIFVHNLWWEKVPEEISKVFDEKVETPIDPESFTESILKTYREVIKIRKKLKVLVVDDLRANCEVAKATLEKIFSAEVDTSLSASEAFELVKKNCYDIIFLDLKMPEINGFEAVKRLRDMGVKVPIIALSADAFKENFEKAFKAGFDDYLTKPFSIERLKSILEKYTKV